MAITPFKKKHLLMVKSRHLKNAKQKKELTMSPIFSSPKICHDFPQPFGAVEGVPLKDPPRTTATAHGVALRRLSSSLQGSEMPP